jgi:hypothetical protein
VRSVALLSLGFSALALAACTADIHGGGGDGKVVGPSGGGATGAGGSAVGGSGPGPLPAGALGGPSLRLLTGTQYRATLRSLFTFADELIFELEDDVALNGLRAIGTSNIALSPKATEAYLHAAETAAERGFGAAAAASTTAGCDVAQAQCASSYLADFGRRAFRRKLTDEESARFVGIYQNGLQKLGTGAAGMKYAVEAVLMSPHFLYRVEIGQPSAGGPTARALSDTELASKLAYFLSNGPPDETLLDLAESGGLKQPGALAAQAGRLLAGASVSEGLDNLFDDYLGLAGLSTVEKLSSRFPEFTPTLASAMREQTLRDLRRTALGTQDFRTIFNSTKTFVNAELAKLYGLSGVSGSELVEVDLPASSGRRGLLGNASLMSMYSHSSISSPTLRGKFIRQILMCQAIPAPPPDVDITLPDETEAKTARERLKVHSTDPTCAGCHTLMDPLGLGLENYDAIGKYRSQENGITLDTSGAVDGVPFTTPAELGELLAQHAGVPNCLSRVVFRYAWGRLEGRADEALITELTTSFQSSSYQMRQLLTAAATSSGFVNVGELDR